MARSKHILLILVCLIVPLIASAAQTWWIKVEWDTNFEKDLVGYRVYHRKAGQPYPYPDGHLGEVDRSRTNCTIKGLEPAVDHFFAITAFDNEELESGLSDELRFRPGSNGGDGDGGCFIGALLI